jgi:hypothetical protein
MKRKLAAAATTVLVACVAAGCGGDGDDDAATSTTATTSGAPVSKAAFITAADAVCTKTNAKIQTAAAKLQAKSKKSGEIPKTDVVKFFKQTSLPAYDDMVQQLGALMPPKSDEAKVNGIIASMAAAIDVVKADPAKFASRDVSDPFDDANKRARDYGMKVCGS